MRVVIEAYFLCMLLMEPLLAQTPKNDADVARPGLIVLPWKASFVSPEWYIRSKPALEQSHKTWRTTLLNNPLSLSKFVEQKRKKTLPLNLAGYADQVFVGEKRGGDRNAKKIAQPILCRVADQLLVVVTQSHSLRHSLQNSGHVLISLQDWHKAIEQKRLRVLFEEALQKAWTRSEENQASPSDPSTLHLGLTAGLQQTHRSSIPGYCLNLLVAEQLLRQGYSLPNSIGLESLSMIDRAIPNSNRLVRSTRQALMTWLPIAGTKIKGFPLKVSLRISSAEAVFASHISKGPLSKWIFNKSDDGSIDVELNKAFIKFIKQEKVALDKKKYPKISYINRAWVYVDKGRAWGLKMNDRLVVSDSPEPIAGHVVGFYGPEMNISSPDGYPVHAGAIVFIRSGQRNAKVGQTLDFDSKRYPTPWPP